MSYENKDEKLCYEQLHKSGLNGEKIPSEMSIAGMIKNQKVLRGILQDDTESHFKISPKNHQD